MSNRKNSFEQPSQLLWKNVRDFENFMIREHQNLFKPVLEEFTRMKIHAAISDRFFYIINLQLYRKMCRMKTVLKIQLASIARNIL